MTQEISSLMDGELAAQEAERAIRSCGASEEQLANWHLYHVIGDTLRGQAPRGLERNTAIRAALAKEPAMIARPKRVMESVFARVSLAAAASVATLGIVGWMGSQGGAPGTQGTPIAKSAAGIQPASATVNAPVVPRDTRDYELAHRQVPTPDVYRANNTSAAPAK